MASPTIAIFCKQADNPLAINAANKLKLPLISTATSDHDLLLTIEDETIGLSFNQSKATPFIVDFLAGKQAFRYHQGTQHSLLIKAFSLPNKQKPSILDLTAGFGRDAYLLACQELHVTMLEREPVIACLLENGLYRAKAVAHPPSQYLTLHNIDAFDYLESLTTKAQPDIIYLDPMFPKRSKTALVKKDMQLLQAIACDPCDYQTLFMHAKKHAEHKIVVKHAKSDPPFENTRPTWQLESKTIRFDIYQQ